MFFNRFDFRPTFVLPVLSDPHKHWSLNRVSFIYVSDLGTESIINFHHNDSEPLKCPTIDEIYSTDTLYAFPKIVQPGALGGLAEASWDRFANAEMMYWFETGQRMKIDPDAGIRSYWRMGIENVNDAVPIMRWIDWCRKVRDVAYRCKDAVYQSGFWQYNRLALNLRRIEQTGLRSIKPCDARSINKKEFSQYDPYTLTGRPSNHFDGINYAGLSNEQRRRFISRFENGFLINIDFSGFHMFLLYLIIGLDFPGDIYKSLSIHYPTGVNAKDHTFKQIYGGINPELLGISPFKEIDNLSIALFERYKSGNLTTLLHGKPIKFPPGLNRSKLFNYLLQNLETEFNGELIDELMKLEFASKLILYTYDSFLFDVAPGELPGFVEKMRSIFADIPYKMQIGRNYGEMTTIKGR